MKIFSIFFDLSLNPVALKAELEAVESKKPGCIAASYDNYILEVTGQCEYPTDYVSLHVDLVARSLDYCCAYARINNEVLSLGSFKLLDGVFTLERVPHAYDVYDFEFKGKFKVGGYTIDNRRDSVELC